MSVTKVLTKKEGATLLQISEKHVQRLVAEHKLQAQRLGHRTLRFRPRPLIDISTGIERNKT
jgi:excisionase family DNA binding protein